MVKIVNSEEIPYGKFCATDKLPNGYFVKDKRNKIHYFHTVIFSLIFTIPIFGLVKGILISLVWPLYLIISIWIYM